jgi:DNA-binding transcriptional ArsR family regulator
MARSLVLPAAKFGIASFGELVSDPSRVVMLLSLMDGQARPATELAEIAGVTRPTASNHLRRLLEGRMVAVEQRGRHRYFRLENAQVADLIESLALLEPAPHARLSTADPARQSLARARTCYRHLAGRVGIAWFASLERRRLLDLTDGSLFLTRSGVAQFTELGLEEQRWPAGKACLDWTERRHHLGGELGALLTRHLFDLGWLHRRSDGRSVEVTRPGGRELVRRFGVPAHVLED